MMKWSLENKKKICIVALLEIIVIINALSNPKLLSTLSNVIVTIFNMLIMYSCTYSFEAQHFEKKQKFYQGIKVLNILILCLVIALLVSCFGR